MRIHPPGSDTDTAFAEVPVQFITCEGVFACHQPLATKVWTQPANEKLNIKLPIKFINPEVWISIIISMLPPSRFRSFKA